MVAEGGPRLTSGFRAFKRRPVRLPRPVVSHTVHLRHPASAPLERGAQSCPLRRGDASRPPGVTQMFVVKEGKPIGIVHVHDLLRAGVA